MAGGLYGAPASDEESLPMDDMSMGGETAAYEPEDDEAAAFVEAFPDNAWDADKMAAFKEGIRLCFERHAEGSYGGSGGSSSKPKGGGDELAIAVFGEPKKKR